MSRTIIILGAGAVISGLLVGIGWLSGASHEQGKARQVENEQLRAAFDQGRQLGVVRDQVITKYVDRVEVVERVGKTIIKEVPVYVSSAADAACVVPTGFVRVHDATAAGVPPPGRAGPADEAPAGIALSAVAGTVAENYTSCNANAEQLIALQELVREYQQATSPNQVKQ